MLYKLSQVKTKPLLNIWELEITEIIEITKIKLNIIHLDTLWPFLIFFQDCKKDGVFVAQKYFSIDRVFRNETLDATHLAEFHQVRKKLSTYCLF
jgi:O-phosphoseryl-tRNA(Cys) synthetase